MSLASGGALERMLRDERAGRLVGVGDFRPTFGRFRIDEWSVEK